MAEEQVVRKKAHFVITEQGYALLRVDVLDIVRAVGMAALFVDSIKQWFTQYKIAQYREQQAKANKYKVEQAKVDSKEFINKKMK